METYPSLIDLNQVNILVVDDDHSIQKLVAKAIKSAGFNTSTASNGGQAIELLTESFFDIVITDIAMPGMDGLELTKKIVNYFKADVIVMTGQIYQYGYDQLIQQGACDFVQKPFGPDEIILRVKRVMQERQLRENLLQSEKELSKSQKLESLGQLASGIAHELNTPIQYIGDNTNFIKDTFQDLDKCFHAFFSLFKAAKENSIDKAILETVQSALDNADIEDLYEEIPQAIEQSLEGVNRMQKIVKAMKVFAHPGKNKHIPTDLNECIQSTVTISKNEWKYIADIVLDLDGNLPMVNCDPGEINQVLLNLIVNASHAIADQIDQDSSQKGKIKISSKYIENWVEIRISDTGTGIPDNIVDKVFHPFFTTKEIGKGTGQGLAISHSVIVDRHKGKLDIETEPGKGAIFIIKLFSE